MVDRQKRCSSEQDKICPSFWSTSFKLTIPQSHSLTVKSLDFLLDRTLSMKNFISQTSKSCCYRLRRISSFPNYLSTEATGKLVISLILSRLDCCSSLLSGLPASSAHSLRSTQNCAARLILREREEEKNQHTHTHTRTHTRTHTHTHIHHFVKLATSLLCFDLSTDSYSHREVSTR